MVLFTQERTFKETSSPYSIIRLQNQARDSTVQPPIQILPSDIFVGTAVNASAFECTRTDPADENSITQVWRDTCIPYFLLDLL